MLIRAHLVQVASRFFLCETFSGHKDGADTASVDDRAYQVWVRRFHIGKDLNPCLAGSFLEGRVADQRIASVR